MIYAPRPKPQSIPTAAPALRRLSHSALLAGLALTPAAAWAQGPMASAYATRDGRAPTSVLGCAAVDGTFTAQPCGVPGYPVHVTIDGGGGAGSGGSGGSGGGTPTTAPGTASSQVVGVQGAGAGALPVQITTSALPLPAGAATAALQSALNPDGGSQVHVQNFPSTQAVSAAALPLPAGAAAAALQGTLNADGGKLAHVTNFPATQPVSAAALPLPAGAATAAAQPALNGDGGALSHVMNFPSTQAVTATSLPLPSGAAQDGSDAAGIAAPTGAAGIRGWLSGIYGAVSGNLKVVVQSGGATLPVSASSLPLPAGAATATAQGTLNADGGKLAHVTNFPATQPVSAAALPLPAGAATAAAQPALNGDGGALSHVVNFPATQAVSAASLPLPAGAATAALQPALNGDGGSQVHVQNFPSSQAVTNAGTFAVQDSAVIAAITTVASNTAVKSSAWVDASFTATGTASTPSALAAVTSRLGLHVWNLGSATVCMNYTGTAAVSGSGCAAGSLPIPTGSAYLEDQPGNVSPEAISLVCVASSCPLTIKVR